jgi:hypothetical protein
MVHGEISIILGCGPKNPRSDDPGTQRTGNLSGDESRRIKGPNAGKTITK